MSRIAWGMLAAVLVAACGGTTVEPPRRPTAPLSTAPSPPPPAAPGHGGVAAVAPPPPAPCGGKKLRVKFYDVGQALSALVELPDGRRILVDTGEQPTRAGCGAPCKAWSAHLLAGLAKDVPDKKLDVIWTTHL